MSSVSTFGAFTTARLGIYASQKALEVVGNNISNINTNGYTRQALNQKSLYMGGSDRYQSSMDARVGGGALVTGVSQLRDPYLDIRYRNEMSSVGAMDAKLAGLEQLGGIFDEVGDGTDGEGFMEAQFNDLIQQIQNMVTQGVGRDEYDSLVRGSASALVSLFNTYAERLDTLAANQRKGFDQDLKEVNTILSEIRDLNASIRKSQIHGGDALEIKDQRNVLIDKLSQFVRIDVSYGEEEIGAGIKVEKLTIKLAGDSSATLVDGTFATQMSVSEGAGRPKLGIQLDALEDANGVTMDGSADVPLGDNDLYGALQSQRELLTEKGEFASQGEIDLDPNAAVKRGIPYYQKALDALANKFATVLNEANKEAVVGYKDGAPVTEGGVLFSNSGDGNDTTGITAANLSISKKWADGEVRIRASSENSGEVQSTNNDNLVHILYLMTADQDYTPGGDSASGSIPFYTGSFQGMLTNISATLADDTKVTTERLQNFSSSADELYVSRDSVSGVDLNDEAMGMMQYQKSYSAACRLMTTIDDMLDKLINGTGRAGL